MRTSVCLPRSLTEWQRSSCGRYVGSPPCWESYDAGLTRFVALLKQLGGFKADLYRVASKSSAAADGQAIAMEDADMLSGRGSPTLESPMPPLSTQHTPQPLSERELMPLRLAERLPVTLPTNQDHLRSMSFRA